MNIIRISTPTHGIRWHQEPGPRGMEWWQYWKGVEHVWYWCGVPVWWRLRMRDRPMHEFIKRL